MDWGALPPEINSARMYAGPGAAPLLAAASGWTALSAGLHETASGLSTTWNTLLAVWSGPSSLAASHAVLAYREWMTQTATQASETAAAATQAVAAYEQAYTMTVPPPVVTANRALLALLVATNFLGINTPAIMETEAHYAEMWAQDAAAMYGYAAQSQAATSQLKPHTAAPTVAKPLVNAPPASNGNGGTNLVSSFFGDPFIQTLNGYGQNAVSGGSFNPTNIASLWMSGHDFMPGQTPDVLAPTPRNIGLPGAPPVAPVVQAEGASAIRIGGLSAPSSWAAAAPATKTVELMGQTSPLQDGSPGAAGTPGMFGAPGSRTGFSNQPKYGRKLTIVPQTPAGG